MTTVKTYDSFDEMMEDMRKAEEHALAQAEPFQRAMSQEDETVYTMRFHPEYGDPLLICSKFPPYAELEQNEIRLGASVEEAKDGTARLKESRERGHMFGQHFSIIEPTGEWGSAHIVGLIPISKETFEFFEGRGWQL